VNQLYIMIIGVAELLK